MEQKRSFALKTKFSDSEADGLTLFSEFNELQKHDDSYTVRGLALPWDEVYESFHGDLTFAKTAFDNTLADIDAGKSHAFLAADGHELDALYLLARTDVIGLEGNLFFEITDRGLEFEATFVNDFMGQAIYKRIELGLLDGCSVGIKINDYEYDEDEETLEYKDVELREVSLVSYPAFKKTFVETAKFADALAELSKDMEQLDENIKELDDELDDINYTPEEVAEIVDLAVDDFIQYLKDLETKAEEAVANNYTGFYKVGQESDTDAQGDSWYS